MDLSLDIKSRLRFTSIENIFNLQIKKKFPSYIVDLLFSLLQFDDVINAILHFIQLPQNTNILIEMFKVLYSYFQKNPEKIKKSDFAAKTLQSVLNCVNENTNNPKNLINASNLKIDSQTINLIYYSAKFSSLMSSELPELLHPMPTNGFILAYLIVTTSCSNGQVFDELLPFVEPFFTSKLVLNPYSFGTICIMSTHKDIDDLPSLKHLISFFKSLSDKPIIQALTPYVLHAALLRLSPSTLKEMPTLISFLSSKLEQDEENAVVFSNFIEKIIEMPDSLSIIKPFCEQLFKLYIRNIRNEIPLFQATLTNENNDKKDSKKSSKSHFLNSINNKITENPLNSVNETIGSAFYLLMNYCSINPFDGFFVSRLERQTDNVILMMIYLIDYINKSSNKLEKKQTEAEDATQPVSSANLQFTVTTFDPILLAMKSFVKKSDTTETIIRLYFHFCGTIIDHYESKNAIKALIQGLENNYPYVSDIFASHCANFSFVFENISRSLKPGKSSMLFVTTLKNILSIHASKMLSARSNTAVLSPSSSSSTATDEVNTETDDVISSPTNCDNFSRSGSESTNFELPDLDKYLTVLPESAIETAPTDATILFCSVLVSLHKFPELFDLLPDSASAISPFFSNALMLHFPKLKSRKFNTKVLSALSNACKMIDISDIYSLSQTFMMLLPGQSMLFLAITLQRLPRSIVSSSLQKMIPFVWDNPDETGRMIALVSYSHPDISIEFIETVLASSTLRKRTFFIFKSSESNEQALIVIFKIIGYCSTFIEINFFVSTFLTFATQLLNKYLTHQSKSPLLYSASLFAIRKLSNRVQSIQDERFEHVFPFKDFLVQYVCAYYLDLGITVIRSLESTTMTPSSLLDSSSSNSQTYDSIILSERSSVESLLKNVPKVLSTLTSMLPLRPIRPYDRHERSVELTTAMIQLSDKSHFESIFKASKMFFCTLLDCNSSLSVFFRIVIPIFQSLLRNPRWNRIIELMDFLCAKYCGKLNIQQSSDVLSKTINNIELLISHVIPLSFQDAKCTDNDEEDVKDKVANIIFSLVTLQCSIRNQILSLPQSIRPIKPETRGMTPIEANSAVCNFIEKYFTSSQIFDLIMSLLGFFLNKDQMLKIHHYGTALSIKKFILDRGSEDFRYDGQITQSLVKASMNEDDSVVSIFIDIIEILLKMRLFSMLSNIMLSDEINDNFFIGVMKKLSNIEEGETKLLNIIAAFFESNESVDEKERKSMNDFSIRAIPYLSNSMKDIDNDTWVKLFIGVSNKVQKIDSTLMKCLVSNEDYDGFLQFAQIITRERLLALQVILSSLPENPSKFFIKLSIAFASTEPETCEGFLNYAINAMLKKTSCFTSFEMMKNLFESTVIDSHCWMSLSESLSALFIQNLRCRSIVVDCTIAFINKIDENELQEFWTSFAEICLANVDKWISIINRLITEGKVHFQSIASILPELIVHLKEKHFQIALNSIALKIKVIENPVLDENDIFDLCELIMKSDYFKDKCDHFLNTFVATLREKKFVYVCCHMIERLCKKIDDNNIFAINALIETMNWMKEGDNLFVIEIIMRILK